MIGEGVLLECIENPAIEEILSVSRKPAGIKHPKLKEYIVPDFLALKESDERLKGYDACFFCAGVSSVGMKEDVYKQITYDTTIHFAECLNPNPGMTFIYVSGGGTDSSEKGRLAWARIKGKTENDLMKMPFKNVFGYRIGFVEPSPGQKRVLKSYRYITWLLPVIRGLAPNFISTMKQVALSMIYVSTNGYHHNIIQVKDIKEMTTARMKG